jgi:hypothetical protein
MPGSPPLPFSSSNENELSPPSAGHLSGQDTTQPPSPPQSPPPTSPSSSSASPFQASPSESDDMVGRMLFGSLIFDTLRLCQPYHCLHKKGIRLAMMPNKKIGSLTQGEHASVLEPTLPNGDEGTGSASSSRKKKSRPSKEEVPKLVIIYNLDKLEIGMRATSPLNPSHILLVSSEFFMLHSSHL